MATQNENDIRVQMFNSFMNCPHRDTEKIREVHQELQKQDPLFYAHLASWYRDNGDIRDHNELFCSHLVTDPYTDNREVGLALFREHAPFMKNRILGFIKGKKVKIREKTGKKIKRGRKTLDETRITEKEVGMKKAIPTSLKTEIRDYLKWLETNPVRFDSVAMRNSRDLKSLYFAKGKHVFSHGDRAQKILFEKEYPEDSKMAVFKKISEAKSPRTAAKLIVEHKVPYTIAVGLVEKITPSILVALVNNMSPQEVINNIASLKEKGAFENADLKKLIEDKLEEAKKSKKVSALKSKTAVKTGRVQDEEIVKKLDEVADAQVKKGGGIKIPTAVLVDRSGSLTAAIEVGKSISALISGASVSDLYVVAFDNVPMEVKSQGKTLSDWERAFKPVRPGGSTSIGCALKYLMDKNMRVEQVVVVTDGGENAHPFFHQVYEEYAQKMGVRPHVVVVHVGSISHTFVRSLDVAKIPYDVYTPNGNDYYGLPGLIQLLSRKSKLDLVMEIMEYPLLKRKPFPN